ncbi:MAG: XRE family transcriptional regulator [Pseudanabaena sp. ELA645]|jgi:DNA-binding transcriptional regulator YiaG
MGISLIVRSIHSISISSIYTTLSEELNKLPRERQELIAARASQIHLEEITLRHLREKLGLSQSELAERLEVQQPRSPR